VLYWAGEGVRIFRVDNPHTKPLPFWQWMIADVRARHPDVIFLSEAFTRPKMMYRLAKIGFSQSYTYFTWRNTKQELAEYLIELSTTEVKEFYRPNFFVNTPDINPYFLQTRGAPASSSAPPWPRPCPDYGASIRASKSAKARRCPAARSISIRRSTRSGCATGTRPATSSPKSPCSIACAARTRRCKPISACVLQRVQRSGPALRQAAIV
jgi:hypothetical protein